MAYDPHYFDFIADPKRRAHAQQVGKARYNHKVLIGTLADLDLLDDYYGSYDDCY